MLLFAVLSQTARRMPYRPDISFSTIPIVHLPWPSCGVAHYFGCHRLSFSKCTLEKNVDFLFTSNNKWAGIICWWQKLCKIRDFEANIVLRYYGAVSSTGYGSNEKCVCKKFVCLPRWLSTGVTHVISVDRFITHRFQWMSRSCGISSSHANLRV